MLSTPTPTPQSARPPTCAELDQASVISENSLLKQYTNGLESNPDISGIGVLVGFFATAWMSYFFMVFHCLLASTEPVNLLDRLFYKGARRFLIKTPSPHWAQTMEFAVLAMSDQQLVTGMAILISGFSQLKQNLLYYHWQVIINLAWFSSATHLSSLMCLEQYFQKHRFIWYARLFFMTGLLVMLSTAIIKTATHEVPHSGGIDFFMPAACIFEWDSYQVSLSMIIGVIMLLVGFVVRVVKMFSATRSLSHSFFYRTGGLWRKALIWSCRKLQVSSFWVQAVFLPFIFINLVFLVTTQCLLDFVRSHTFGILWLLISLIWGTIRLMYIRQVADLEFHNFQHLFEMNIFKEENTWSFGQVAPVLLLLTPILLLCEGLSEMVYKRHTLPKKDTSSNCICSSQIELQQHLQPTLPGTDRNLNTAQAQSDQTLITQPQVEINDGVTKCASKPLCNRILSLCGEEFRHQPWYQDNLLFAMASTIAGTTYILPFAQTKLVDTVVGLSIFTFPLFFIFMVIIPLCGIQDMFDPVQLTQKHPLSLVRLAIDPRRPYFIFRCVLFLYFSVSLIPFVIPLFYNHITGFFHHTTGYDNINNAVRLLLFFMFAFLIFLIGLCGSLIIAVFSMYRQLSSQRSVEENLSLLPRAHRS